MPEQNAAPKKRIKDSVTPGKMYERCVEKFGFAIVPFSDPVPVGFLCSELWGAYMAGELFRITGSATRKEWRSQVNWVNERWAGFVTERDTDRTKKEFPHLRKVVKV